MNPNMELMNAFHELEKAAQEKDDFHSAMVYSTAADLTDGLLKGRPFMEASEHLLTAFKNNSTSSYNNELEQATWREAITVLEVVRAEVDEYIKNRSK